MKIWILDENHLHVATIEGTEQNIRTYAEIYFPFSEGFHIDQTGPRCVNASFDLNPEATEIEV